MTDIVQDMSNGETLPPSGARYASFTVRFMALVTDFALVALALTIILILGAVSDRIPGTGRIEVLLIWSLLLLYEPVMVWRRGATIGHRRYGLQVLMDDGRPPGFIRSLARYLVKAVLGLFSFIPMFLTRRHQALQDLLTHTHVVVDASADAPEHFVAAERDAGWMGDVPPLWRRLLLTFVYLAGLFLVLVIGDGMLPSECVQSHQCNGTQLILLEGMTWAWLAGDVLVIIAGWRGLLPGARRRTISDVPAIG